MCKLEGACFWEKTLGSDYLPHHLTLPQGLYTIHNDNAGCEIINTGTECN